MDMEFTSLSDLYKHVMPALTSRKDELSKLGYNYINEDDIWNYLKEVKWKNASNLSLAEMVNDILNTEDTTIDNYLKTKLNLKERNLYFKGVQDEEEIHS